MSRAASLAARSGLARASPTNGTSSVRLPAVSRLSDTPVAPISTWRPTAAMVDTAEWTAAPTDSHTMVQPSTTISLRNWPTKREGVVA